MNHQKKKKTFYFYDNSPPVQAPASASAPTTTTTTTARPKFPVRAELNDIIRVWASDQPLPWEMEVDAFVSITNERLQPVDPSAVNLFDAAGPSLRAECDAVGTCRTGEAKATDAGPNLPATKVIHTVGPRYAEKYHTAAENALSHCYRGVLECLVECDLRTLAVPPVYSEAKGYPREPAAHVAVRTIRRFLERWPHKVDAVVLCLPPKDAPHYLRATLPLYFPRDEAEVARAERELPADTGNESGEMLIEERNLRIASFPVSRPRVDKAESSPGGGGEVKRSHSGGGGGEVDLAYGVGVNNDSGFLGLSESPEARRRRLMRHAEDFEGTFGVGSRGGEGLAGGGRVTQGGLHYGDLLDGRGRCASSVASSASSVAPTWSRSADLFRPPSSSVAPTSPSSSRAQRDLEHQAIHASLVRRARQLDLADMASARAICVGGKDFVGRRVVTVVAAHLEPIVRAGDEQRMLMYAAAELSSVVAAPGGYSLVYFHAGGVFAAPPSLRFVQQLHAALGPRHKENLKMFYVVHPTAMLKAAIWGMTAFNFGVSSRVFGKAEYVEFLGDLFGFVKEDQMDVPEHVRQYDRDLLEGKV